MDIGIIGGTGPAGQALAARLSANGHDVFIGSRDSTRSEAIASQLVGTWPSNDLHIKGVINDDLGGCSIFVLATPWEAAVPTAESLAPMLKGKVLVSMVNALAKIGGEFQALTLARGSVAASVQSVLPEVKVSAAFHHVPARELGTVDQPISYDVLICADSPEAHELTSALVTSVAGLRAISCGSLASATAVEALTAVLLNVNINYKAHTSLRLTGIGQTGTFE